MNRNKFSVFLLVLVLVMALCSCGNDGTKSKAELESGVPVSSVSAEPIAELEPVQEEPEIVSYPGFADRYFDSENREFIMSNSEENTVSFIFELKDNGGKVLYTSEPVAAGEDVEWDVFERWQEGRHRLVISVTPVRANGEYGNTMTQAIAVEIH